MGKIKSLQQQREEMLFKKAMEDGKTQHRRNLKLEAQEIEPLFDNILVKYIPPGETEGGLIIPESATDHAPIAEVIKVGPGSPLQDGGIRAPCVKPGDKILMTDGTEVGEDLYLVRDRNISMKIHCGGLN